MTYSNSYSNELEYSNSSNQKNSAFRTYSNSNIYKIAFSNAFEYSKNRVFQMYLNSNIQKSCFFAYIRIRIFEISKHSKPLGYLRKIREHNYSVEPLVSAEAFASYSSGEIY